MIHDHRVSAARGVHRAHVLLAVEAECESVRDLRPPLVQPRGRDPHSIDPVVVAVGTRSDRTEPEAPAAARRVLGNGNRERARVRCPAIKAAVEGDA